MAKIHKFKIGDTVQRITGSGKHGSYGERQPFIIQSLDGDGDHHRCDKGYGHSGDNLELVKAKDSVINEYEIY